MAQVKMIHFTAGNVTVGRLQSHSCFLPKIYIFFTYIFNVSSLIHNFDVEYYNTQYRNEAPYINSKQVIFVWVKNKRVINYLHATRPI